ncbi:MAG: hypothetical protein QXO91_00700 [Desulfurococcaceae archaeon]
MAKYSSKEALNELKHLESLITSRAENLLQKKNSKGVAEILISIDNEIYQTKREARKLRLMDKLDYEVYKTLMDGYVELQKKIIKLSGKHGLERDVRYVFFPEDRDKYSE